MQPPREEKQYKTLIAHLLKDPASKLKNIYIIFFYSFTPSFVTLLPEKHFNPKTPCHPRGGGSSWEAESSQQRLRGAAAFHRWIWRRRPLSGVPTTTSDASPSPQ